METKEQKIENLQKRYIGLSWLVYGTYSDLHTDEVIDCYKQEKEIFNLNDLICLCKECHSKFHNKGE